MKGIKSVIECYKHLERFNPIYGDNAKPIPDNVKVTVYCEGTNEKGFAINLTRDELGLTELIAQKWILHRELEKLAGTEIF